VTNAKREKESDYKMKIRALHISYKDVTKMKARTVMCEISVLSVGARDR